MSNPESFVTNSDWTKEKIRFLKNNVEPKLNEKEKLVFTEALVKYRNKLHDAIISKEAVRSKKRFDSINKNLSSQVCPLCNSNLVLRQGRYGKFWGCSRFPYCRGTRRN